MFTIGHGRAAQKVGVLPASFVPPLGRSPDKAFELTKLDLGPADTLVVRVRGCLTEEMEDRIKQRWTAAVPGRRIVIVDDSIELSALKAGA